MFNHWSCPGWYHSIFDESSRTGRYLFCQLTWTSLLLWICNLFYCINWVSARGSAFHSCKIFFFQINQLVCCVPPFDGTPLCICTWGWGKIYTLASANQRCRYCRIFFKTILAPNIETITLVLSIYAVGIFHVFHGAYSL